VGGHRGADLQHHAVGRDHRPRHRAALTGAIPAAATQAGFTHCAANYDFTQTGSFTSGGHTYQCSNLSSWLESAGALTLLLFDHDYGIPIDCSDVSVVMDSACNCQVLQMIYQPTDTSGQT
jgi:hypothetical protein